MEVPFRLRRNPLQKFREDPNIAKRENFWKGVKISEILESDPETAIDAAKLAILSGVEHPGPRKLVTAALRMQNSAEDVAKKLMSGNVHPELAKTIIEGLDPGAELRDKELIKQLLKYARSKEHAAKILGTVRTYDTMKEIIKEYRTRVKNDPEFLRAVASNPLALKAALELEIHGELGEKALERLQREIYANPKPAELADIIINTVEKDIKTRSAALATAKIMGRFFDKFAEKNPQQVLQIYEKIKNHLVEKDGKIDKEFGRALVNVAGPKTAIALAKIAKKELEIGDEARSRQHLLEAAWLLKETVKHWVGDEKTDAEHKELLDAIHSIVAKAPWHDLGEEGQKVVGQILRAIELLPRSGATKALDRVRIQRLSQALANLIHEDSIKTIAKLYKSLEEDEHRRIFINAYLSAQNNPIRAKQIVTKLVQTDPTIWEQLVRDISKKDYLPRTLLINRH